MNKFFAFIAICFVANAATASHLSVPSHYGNALAAPAPALNVASYLPAEPSYAAAAVAPGYGVAGLPINLALVEPSPVLPNILPPSHHGYGAVQHIAAAQHGHAYGAHGLANHIAHAGHAGYGAHAVLAPIAHHHHAAAVHHAPLHRVPVLVPAISHAAGVKPASASSSSRSSKIQAPNANVYGVPAGVPAGIPVGVPAGVAAY